MATINKKQTIFAHEGGKARNITLVQQLERTVMSCMLWESEAYEGGQLIAERIAELVAKIDADDVIKIALKAKEDMRLRHVPLFIIRECFRKKEARKKCGEALERIITRPDDITEFLAIYWLKGKEPLAKQAKLAIGRAFHKFDEYQLAKYNGGKKSVSLVDALRVTHPEPTELLGKLRRNELATPDTWEVELSKSTDKKSSWDRLLDEKKIGGLALLRNIRNIEQAGVDRSKITESIKQINAGRLTPINFFASAVANPSFEAVIEEKFFNCFQKEKAKGPTVVLIDVSASMYCDMAGRSKMKRSDVAIALGMIARETFEDVRLFSFSDNVVELPSRRGFAIRDLLNSQTHGGTYLGGAIHSIKNDINPDRLIIITDEQSHDKVPDFKGYLINVASNKNGVGYGQCVHIDGWSDKVIDYILEYEAK